MLTLVLGFGPSVIICAQAFYSPMKAVINREPQDIAALPAPDARPTPVFAHYLRRRFLAVPITAAAGMPMRRTIRIGSMSPPAAACAATSWTRNR